MKSGGKGLILDRHTHSSKSIRHLERDGLVREKKECTPLTWLSEPSVAVRSSQAGEADPGHGGGDDVEQGSGDRLGPGPGTT